MYYQTIEKSITIAAPPSRVWAAFTDPALTRRMGGEYVSTWKKGSSIAWKGRDGKIATKGIILTVEPGLLLRHELHDLKKGNLLSLITYVFVDQGGSTLLEASEELNYPVNEAKLKETSEGWDYALELLKRVAEGV